MFFPWVNYESIRSTIIPKYIFFIVIFFTTIHFSTVIHYPALYILINTTHTKNFSQYINAAASSFAKKKLWIQGEQVCFLQHNEGKKIFASKKIWFGNSRTNVFLGQNILFRLRIICTCCLYNKHACRKLDWSTSFKIHIRCQVFDKIPVWFWFFFVWKFKFYLIPHVQW